MDLMTLAMAKAYSDKKGGYVEPGKVYTYDGKAEKVETVGNYTYAIIATDAPSLSELTKAVGTFADGSTVEFSKEELSFETLGESIEAASATLMGMTVPLIVWEDGVLLVYSMEGVGYGSRVEFAETVVPIDPKFTPGVLPVVSIDWDTISSAYVANGEKVALPTEVCEQLNTVKNDGNTMLVKAFTGEIGYVITLCTADYTMYSEDSLITTFQCTMSVMSMTLKVSIEEQYNGGWTITVTES